MITFSSQCPLLAEQTYILTKNRTPCLLRLTNKTKCSLASISTKLFTNSWYNYAWYIIVCMAWKCRNAINAKFKVPVTSVWAPYKEMPLKWFGCLSPGAKKSCRSPSLKWKCYFDEIVSLAALKIAILTTFSAAKWWHSHFSDFIINTIFLSLQIPFNIIRQSSNHRFPILIGGWHYTENSYFL